MKNKINNNRAPSFSLDRFFRDLSRRPCSLRSRLHCRLPQGERVHQESQRRERQHQGKYQISTLSLPARLPAYFQLPVIREGKEIMVHVNYLHVGDVIVLKVGQVIPVDGIVISSEQLSTNEAAMTGESDPCKKESTEDCLQRRVEYEAELGDTK
jgi:hypothetical protein